MHPLFHPPVPGHHPESGSPQDVTAAPTTTPRETPPQAGRDVSFTAFWDFFFFWSVVFKTKQQQRTLGNGVEARSMD